MSDPSRRPAAFRLAIRSYAAQMRRDARVSIPGLLFPGLGSIFTWYLPPLVVARMLSRFVDGGQLELGDMTPYLVTFVAVWLTGEAIWRVGIHFINRTCVRGATELYESGMDALFEKDVSFFHDNFAGSLTKKVIAYSQSYMNLLDTLCFWVAPSLVPLAFVSVVLWRYSPWLCLTLVVMVGLTGLAVAPLIRRRKAMVDAREAASNEVAGHVADVISNMEAVRLFAREREEAAAHSRNVAIWSGLALRSWDYQNRRIDVTTSPMYVLTNLLGLVLAVALSDGRNAATFEAVFVAFAYYSRFTQIVWDFNHIYRSVETELSAAAQFTELLLDEPIVNDPEEPETPAFRDGSIAFDGVNFAYPKRRDEPLFRSLDLFIPSGQRVGLVGRSGGGKSTLTKLLLRMMDVDGGAIRVGGQDIARVRQADIRGQIAYVPQDPVMFHRSLRANIAFGRLDASDEEIHAAAVAAHAAEFIDGLPEGYDTLVGERGIKLSGGQRQRLAIARALLRHAPILVLDEATSSLDSESEALIQQALLTLMRGRTTLVIAHRLSTIRMMDRLIVLEHGEVVEDGSHDELLAADGFYASLWARQSGAFLPDAMLT
ncbi:MAG TPA: ABC transporter ATP-binding protein [Acidimicrobiales bacterium]